MSPQGKN